jgi:hypothetical protein
MRPNMELTFMIAKCLKSFNLVGADEKTIGFSSSKQE